jgi:hypothetical protein
MCSHMWTADNMAMRRSDRIDSVQSGTALISRNIGAAVGFDIDMLT